MSVGKREGPHECLRHHDIILASASPRRRQLLRQIGVPVTVVPSKFEENLPKTSKAEEYVSATAEGKAGDVHTQYPDSVIIAADTIVVLDGVILEKPRDVAHAHTMLRDLSGKTHSVVTAVCLMFKEQKRSFYVQTDVKFAELTDNLIAWYVETDEPLDKAGGYGIQGKGAILVEKINGCYFNVVGLPVQRLLTELQSFLSCS